MTIMRHFALTTIVKDTFGNEGLRQVNKSELGPADKTAIVYAAITYNAVRAGKRTQRERNRASAQLARVCAEHFGEDGLSLFLGLIGTINDPPPNPGPPP